MNKHTRKAIDQTINVIGVLAQYGHTVKNLSGSWSPCDILMDGNIKIEVKTGRYLKKSKRWLFNIHRHNTLKEAQVDFYVLRFLDVPGTKRAVHALYKAPVKKVTMEFSIRELIEGKISQAVKDFRKLNLRSKKSSP